MPLSRLTSNSISTSQAVQTFSTANTERMRIDSDGNVGIGMTPVYKFDLTGGFRKYSTNATDYNVLVIQNGELNEAQVGLNSDRLQIRTVHAGSLDLMTNNAIRMSIASDGKVGINTNSPIAALDIVSNSSAGNQPGLAIRNTSGATPSTFGPAVSLSNGVSGKHGYVINQEQSTDSSFQIANDGSPYERYLTINQIGNIGIGTTSPGYRLDVVSADAVGHAVRIRSNTSATKARIQFTNNDATQQNGYIESGDTQYLAFITVSSERMRIDSSGRIYGTSQPTFLATSSIGNQLLSNGADLPFNIATVNIGNCFNTSNYRFTAPIAGRYLLSFHLFCQNTTGRVFFKKNGADLHGLQSQTLTGDGASATVIVSLAANDYITVGDWQNLAGGTYYMGHSLFSGALIL